MKLNMIITIDGPAASGKSSVAKKIAEIFNAKYLDTGAIYRAVAYKTIKNGIDENDKALVERIANDININIKYDSANKTDYCILIDNKDVTNEIRLPEVTSRVSKISGFAGVRKSLLPIQKNMAKDGNLVAEGRDLGTVVFPNADIKIFLVASAYERAKRRKIDLKNIGFEYDLKSIEKKIIERDMNDRTRGISPMKRADDAHIIDTTNKNINEVVDEIAKIVKRNVKTV